MKTFMLPALICIVCSSSLRAQLPSQTGNESPLLVKVQLGSSVKLSSLKPGDSVEGNLTRDVYSPESRVFTSGSHVHLTVSRVERRHKTAGEKWPWVAKIFLPHHENYPIFNEASISMPDGTKSDIQTSLLFSSRIKEIRPPVPRNRVKQSDNSAAIHTNPEAGSRKDAAPTRGPVLYLEAYGRSFGPVESSTRADFGSSVSSTVPAGTICDVLLLEDVSASKSHVGDEIHARLLEPILSDSHVVIPAGSVFEGRVMQAMRPRIPSRAGSLAIAFVAVRSPEGSRTPVSASLASVDVNAGSPIKMDREGRLHGSRPGALWMLINGGVAGGIAKEVDDGTQLIVEAIVSTATDASTAGTARIAGSIVSGVYMLTRKGHDVVLPDHTEMAITLNRPLTFSAETAKNPAPAGQNTLGN